MNKAAYLQYPRVSGKSHRIATYDINENEENFRISTKQIIVSASH